MEIEYNVKKEARNQYLKYFKVWFVILGILVALTAVVLFGKMIKNRFVMRTNYNAPQERVYDQADVLTDTEEKQLREKIADAEKKIMCDIVVVTIDQPVEGWDAMNTYGYRYDDWELNMRDIADDFYDYNHFGYDNDDYDGVLLLDNWYKDEYGSQQGSWLSTSGEVYERFGDSQINQVVDAVYYKIKAGASPYTAYCAYVDKVVALMSNEVPVSTILGIIALALIVPTISAAIYVPVNMNSKAGNVTTNVSTYIDGNVRINVQRDELLRKSVSSVRISTDSSYSGGSRSSSSGGRGGSHRSSSGRSHGGGGRRR